MSIVTAIIISKANWPERGSLHAVDSRRRCHKRDRFPLTWPRLSTPSKPRIVSKVQQFNEHFWRFIAYEQRELTKFHFWPHAFCEKFLLGAVECVDDVVYRSVSNSFELTSNQFGKNCTNVTKHSIQPPNSPSLPPNREKYLISIVRFSSFSPFEPSRAT